MPRSASVSRLPSGWSTWPRRLSLPAEAAPPAGTSQALRPGRRRPAPRKPCAPAEMPSAATAPCASRRLPGPAVSGEGRDRRLPTGQQKANAKGTHLGPSPGDTKLNIMPTNRQQSHWFHPPGDWQRWTLHRKPPCERGRAHPEQGAQTPHHPTCCPVRSEQAHSGPALSRKQSPRGSRSLPGARAHSPAAACPAARNRLAGGEPRGPDLARQPQAMAEGRAGHLVVPVTPRTSVPVYREGLCVAE